MTNNFDLEEISYEDEGTGTVYRDLITICLLAFISMVILLLIIVNPSKKTSEIKMPGFISMELVWDNDADVDIDFWAKAPNDTPVGYPNKHSFTLDLVRDDLGLRGDPMPFNFENIFARSIIPDDEYILNIHIYSWRTTKPSITVVLNVLIKDEKGEVVDGYKTSVVLTAENNREEITLVRFEIDKSRKIKRETMNNEFFAIRSGEFVTFEENKE